MPLPADNAPWPPVDPVVRTALADWSAWYSANPDKLCERYSNRGTHEANVRPSQFRGGWSGRIARWWWGQPTPLGERRAHLHVPLASDIARTSSELLFSEPPKLTVENTAAQERIEQLIDGGLRASLLEGGQVCAALGGVFLRTVWDTDVSDRAWIAPVHADAAIPEFSYGRLRAATFWTVLESDDNRVVRHLERHERGVILHGVYEGTKDNLGKKVDLGGFTATREIAKHLPAGDYKDTGAPGHLTASYIPNMRPARDWRDIPTAAGWGQSDYQGIEGLMDSLDETYSSWMRDIRNGKGRVLMPDSFLTSNGPGQGATFEDRQIFAGLKIPPTGDNTMQIVQFQIRVAEHRDTAAALIGQAIRQAGYSGATFAEAGEGAAVTATEIKARERRSMTTRATKALYWAPGVAEQVETLLAVEAGLFSSGVNVERPDVEFQDSVTDDPKEVAETASLMRQAEAASTEVLVRMLHSDWDKDRVAAEVAAIERESGRSVEDPFQAGAMP